MSVKQARFVGSAATAAGLDLNYSLDVAQISTGQTGTSSVRSTMVQGTGAIKICGEQ